jgi:hypothetical protein
LHPLRVCGWELLAPLLRMNVVADQRLPVAIRRPRVGLFAPAMRVPVTTVAADIDGALRCRLHKGLSFRQCRWFPWRKPSWDHPF